AEQLDSNGSAENRIVPVQLGDNRISKRIIRRHRDQSLFPGCQTDAKIRSENGCGVLDFAYINIVDGCVDEIPPGLIVSNRGDHVWKRGALGAAERRLRNK